MAMLKLEEGTILVQAARKSIENAYENRDTRPPTGSPSFDELRGAFVTLNTYPGGELRGCIGFVGPYKPLGVAVVEAAKMAAFEDMRFLPLKKSELQSIVIEVSVLSNPEPIKAIGPQERLKAVKIGKSGLMLQYGRASGLLLPQVAVEWNFTPQMFLEALCEKAGLPKDLWKSPSAKLWEFEAEIYAEQTPGGKVVRKQLIV